MDLHIIENESTVWKRLKPRLEMNTILQKVIKFIIVAFKIALYNTNY
jgi:large-conductance mechanosensitive channel